MPHGRVGHAGLHRPSSVPSALGAAELRRRITVCGGTSLGHALVAVLAANPENEVTVWTQQPTRWSREIRAIYLDIAEVRGAPARVTSVPEIAVSGAEIIFVCTPLQTRTDILRQIARYVQEGCWIGGVPGFGGFDWAAADTLGDRVVVFGLQRVPYVRRTVSYGEVVWISGIRPRLYVGSIPNEAAPDIACSLEELLSIPTTPLSRYAAVNLSASNAIFHPARLVSAFPPLTFELKGDGEQFYEDWDDAASETYLALDTDVQSIAIALRVSPLEAQPISDHFGISSVSELTARIRDIRALRDRRLPLRGNRRSLDRESHYVTEDACFALPSLKRMADLAGIESPRIDAALRWSELACDRKFLREGRLEGSDSGLVPQPQSLQALLL